MWAYPRSRGATIVGAVFPINLTGLSPLTRGHLARLKFLRKTGGPIPAHAGQPAIAHLVGRVSGAYPRSRGATLSFLRLQRCQRGLSPLTRGNQCQCIGIGPWAGPIPAHAGQPGASWIIWLMHRAYPRSRGATATRYRVSWLPRGLSPLTRGNLSFMRGPARPRGPIPAHAGQPDLPAC